SLSLWMHANGRAIYGCTYAPEEFKAPEGTRLTYNKTTRRLYVHLMEYPDGHELVLPGYKDRVRYVQFLHDASEIKTKVEGDDVRLLLPERKPNVAIPVVEIILR
ncbi:MAG: alpha-L-fucosidase, partial [Bacteroidetes bacterium]|nr:alpha-L-fucosidase [Bacteroidota bacterium]